MLCRQGATYVPVTACLCSNLLILPDFFFSSDPLGSGSASRSSALRFSNPTLLDIISAQPLLQHAVHRAEVTPPRWKATHHTSGSCVPCCPTPDLHKHHAQCRSVPPHNRSLVLGAWHLTCSSPMQHVVRSVYLQLPVACSVADGRHRQPVGHDQQPRGPCSAVRRVDGLLLSLLGCLGLPIQRSPALALAQALQQQAVCRHREYLSDTWQHEKW